MCILVDGVSKSFSKCVLNGVSLTVEEGEVVCLMGANGSGKTTLFQIVSGILEPDSGSVFLRGKKPTETFPSIVYQDYRESLFPWLTAKQNVELATKSRRNHGDADPDADNLLDKLGIYELRNKYPYELSGGETQLVSIARAFAFGGDVFLFDEPGSALGFDMKLRFHAVFLELQGVVSRSALVISHDPMEAVNLSNRVLIFPRDSTAAFESVKIDLPHPRDRGSNEYIKCQNEILTFLK